MYGRRSGEAALPTLVVWGRFSRPTAKPSKGGEGLGDLGESGSGRGSGRGRRAGTRSKGDNPWQGTGAEEFEWGTRSEVEVPCRGTGAEGAKGEEERGGSHNLADRVEALPSGVSGGDRAVEPVMVVVI
jgi:hypothetical protein